MNVNTAFFGGNLTKDPELRQTPTGTPVCAVSIANNRPRKVGNEWKTEVTYMTAIVWGKMGEACHKKLSKGKPFLVEGRIQNRSYENRDGHKVNITEIVAEKIFFAREPKTDASGKTTEPASPRSLEGMDAFTDEGFSAQEDGDAVPF